jgi:nitrate/nitrite-specific signal transduction histidine kinase
MIKMIDVVTIINIGMLLINVLLVSLIYKHVRHIYKPLITTKIISHEKTISEKNITSRPSVLEETPLYLVVSNVSNNSALNLKVQYALLLDNQKLTDETRDLKYLNPNEATRMLINCGKVIDQHPELFDEIQVKNTIITIPKKSLTLSLDVKITCGFLLKHEMKDSYQIEWGSLKSYPRVEDHPVLLCWNKRNGMYIYKISEKNVS